MYLQSWKSTLGVFYMTKISVKTKLKAVEEYANGNVTLASVRHKYGIAEHDFQIWVGIYARFGKGPLLNPPKVTGDFRLNLVKWKQENLASISEQKLVFTLDIVPQVQCISGNVSITSKDHRLY